MGNTYNNFDIIRVIPTLTEDSAYADGDVLFTATEIPNAVIGNGGCSKLLGGYLIDSDRDSFTAHIIFTEKNTAIGTIHNTANISDADFRAIGFCGALMYTHDTAELTDLDNIRGSKLESLSASNESVEPILLQAEAGSTSVYVSAVLASGTPTFANTDDIQLVLHIQKK